MNPIITHHYHIKLLCIIVSHDNEDYYGIIMIITSIYIYIMGNIDFICSRRETEKHHPITKSMFLNNQQLWACLEPCHENSINQHPKHIQTTKLHINFAAVNRFVGNQTHRIHGAAI